jgi:hypothetical protein
VELWDDKSIDKLEIDQASDRVICAVRPIAAGADP